MIIIMNVITNKEHKLYFVAIQRMTHTHTHHRNHVVFLSVLYFSYLQIFGGCAPFSRQTNVFSYVIYVCVFLCVCLCVLLDIQHPVN